MIQRNPLNAAVSHSEPLHQASFTAMKGVDASKAVTAPDVVQNMENLDVNTDRSVSVRKPLILKKSYTTVAPYTVENLIPLYDADSTLIVYKGLEKTYIAIDTPKGFCNVRFYVERLDYTGKVAIGVESLPSTKLYDVTSLMCLDNVQYVNTTSSTVLSNVTLDLTNSLVNRIIYNDTLINESDSKNVYRYLQVTRVDTEFQIVVKTPEINTLDTGSEFVLNTNLTLDNPYAIRDTYDSGHVSVNGILPYVYCYDKNTPMDMYVAGQTSNSSFKYERAVDTSFYDNVLPPTNPLLVEFLGDPAVYDSKGGAGFMSLGGVIRIWFNSFRFGETPTIHTRLPKSVTIQLYTVEFNSEYNVIDVGTDYTKAMSGGMLRSRTVTLLREDFQGNTTDGFYVDIKNVPFVGMVTGCTKGLNGYSEFTYSELSNVKYESDGTLREEGQFRTVITCTTHPEYPYTHSMYTSHSPIYAQGCRYTSVGGLFELDMRVTVNYDDYFEGVWDVYFNIHDFPGNRFATTSFDKRACIFAWFDPKSPVQDNYPMLISTCVSEHKMKCLDTHTVSKDIFDGDTQIAASVLSEQYVSVFTEYIYPTLGGVRIKSTKGSFKRAMYITLTSTVSSLAPGAAVDVSAMYTHGTESEINGTDSIHFNVQDVGTYVRNVECPYSNYVDMSVWVGASVPSVSLSVLKDYTVERLTESVSYPKFQIANKVGALTETAIFLKAFMSLKPDSDSMHYYGVWEYTFDGINWNPWHVPSAPLQNVFKQISIPTYTTSKTEEGKFDTTYRIAYGILFNPTSPTDKLLTPYDADGNTITDDSAPYYLIPNRPDVVFIRAFTDLDSVVFNVAKGVHVRNVQFKFTVCTIHSDDDGTNVATVLDTQDYTLDTGLEWEFPSFDFGNAVEGSKLYYRNSIYSFNSPHSKNNIFVSDANSFITPIKNIIDVSTSYTDTVKALVPWRNYLVGFTEHSVHLIQPLGEGATVKTVSTYIGISDQDRNTCKAILNGIVFKSGSKIYTLYPNVSSGDETILNLSEISHPVAHVLENLKALDTPYDTFAISTDRAYSVFIPFKTHTYCLKYDYSLKVWTVFKYDGVRFTDYRLASVDDITIYGVRVEDNVLCEFYYDKELKDAYPNFIEGWEITSFDNVPYGDFLTADSLTPTSTPGIDVPSPQPIEFKLDSGQRTDNLSLTKKFSESKFLLATLNSNAAAKINVEVYVDGNPYKIRLKGDGIVYKDEPEQILTLGENMQSENSDACNTVSQVFLRYSGKGKTIRHVITGSSLYNFKLYEVFYRYRPMPNKQ